MPSYRSINISLISQFDFLEVPEYKPPLVSNDPFSDAPINVDEARAIVSVYVPIYSDSQFWIQYSILPPHPPKALYYLKVIINDKQVVSWGCGDEEGFDGKIMFAMCKTETSAGEKTLEKRTFAFGSENNSKTQISGKGAKDMIEIRVYRSKARRRIEPDVDYYQQPSSVIAHGDLKWSDHMGGNIKLANSQNAPHILMVDCSYSLVKAGIIGREHPRRYYQYALLDPLDKPFAIFRYYPRTFAQLEEIGVQMSDSSESSIHTFPSDYEPSDDKSSVSPRSMHDLHSATIRYKDPDANDSSPLSMISEHSEPNTSSPRVSLVHAASEDQRAEDSPGPSPIKIARPLATLCEPSTKILQPLSKFAEPSSLSRGHQQRLSVLSPKTSNMRQPKSTLSSSLTAKDSFTKLVRQSSAETNSDGRSSRLERREGAASPSGANGSTHSTVLKPTTNRPGGLGVSALRKMFEGRLKGRGKDD